MVPWDRAMAASDRLSIVISGLAAIFNKKNSSYKWPYLEIAYLENGERYGQNYYYS